jgi:hypothetical protein
MALATPVTNKFHIGSAELRIGPLNLANKLTQAHSVGLLQSATVNFAQESVDLEAGLPKTLIDTVIVSNNVTVSAQAYEYSRKNIKAMLNAGTEATPLSEYFGTAASVVVKTGTGTSSIDTDLLLTDVTVGDLLVIYKAAAPEQMSIVQVTAKAAFQTTKASITIDNTKTPLLFDTAIGDVIYKANQIGLGTSAITNYFAAEIIGVEHSTGRPIGFKFWKATLSGGMEYGFSNDNFAVTPMTLKILQPPAVDFTGTGPLVHLAGIIPQHPYGMYFGG